MAAGIVNTRDSYQATTKALEFAFTNASNSVPPQFPRLFTTMNFDPVRSIATILPVAEIGLFQPRTIEGAAFSTDSPQELIPATFTYGTWGLSSYVSEEAQTEDPIGWKGMLPQMLANSERFTMDFLAWDTLNLGATPATISPIDGQPLFSTAHPLGLYFGDDGQTRSLTGETASNSLVNAPINPETIRQAEILLQTLRTDRGLPDERWAKYFVCSINQAKIGQEVLGAKLAPYTNENQGNTAEGTYEIMAVRYITSQTFWGLFCPPGDWRNGGNVNQLLVSFKWRGKTESWYDPPSSSYGIKSSFRWTFGYAGWRGCVLGSS